MSIRLVAKPVDHDSYAINVAGAQFWAGKKGKNSSDRQHRQPPVYPRQLRRERVSGSVYLLLQVDRDGKVHRVAARQVDLLTRGPKPLMNRWRRALAKASVAAAKNWQLAKPDDTQLAPDGYWYAMVPVNYRLIRRGETPKSFYGKWQAYIPGPRQFVPWAGHHAVANADAIPSTGGVYPLRQSLHLLTPIGGGS